MIQILYRSYLLVGTGSVGQNLSVSNTGKSIVHSRSTRSSGQVVAMVTKEVSLAPPLHLVLVLDPYQTTLLSLRQLRYKRCIG